ncbi:uncharacterized protein V1510DRAFT_412959 [Dipodascopsis tothii]|uniref:uncharacterized protein n=1 Tax=Dipodascopsis tothii TaxID=44089 RepID=UPI0034CF471F
MSSYSKERRVAELAVERACKLTQAVAESSANGEVTKDDASPVTVADFGAQAVVIGAINHNFAADPVVGEEDSAILREKPELKARVWGLAQAAAAETAGSTAEIGELASADHMLEMLDLGMFEGGRVPRMWALDPVDGTKGFLRREQYAVCLALLVDSEVVVGVIGCPNLPVDPTGATPGKGMLFSAVKGQGAFARPLDAADADFVRIRMNDIPDAAAASFCESVEAGHSSHGQQARIAALLGITKPSVRMDSQAKYASIARGDGDIYLRLPVSATYQEKIWDHAAGNVLVAEAGGIVSDMHGNPLDFSLGRTLRNNKGIVAAAAGIQPSVVAAVQKVLAEDA